MLHEKNFDEKWPKIDDFKPIFGPGRVVRVAIWQNPYGAPWTRLPEILNIRLVHTKNSLSGAEKREDYESAKII